MTEVERLRAEKEKMERAIAASAHEALSDFKRATGLTPGSITVHLAVIERVGSPPEHIVSHVSASVEL